MTYAAEIVWSEPSPAKEGKKVLKSDVQIFESKNDAIYHIGKFEEELKAKISEVTVRIAKVYSITKVIE